jgi:hypothetical protein
MAGLVPAIHAMAAPRAPDCQKELHLSRRERASRLESEAN